jgi:hypothetical protein
VMERWIESEIESATRRPSIFCTISPHDAGAFESSLEKLTDIRGRSVG